MRLFGGIEAGGTKFVCAVGTGPDDVRASVRFATTTPSATLAQVIDFFRQQPEPVASIGVGAFGPVDLNPSSPTYGYITSTPKPGWQQTDVRGALSDALGIPIGFEHDVAVAAIGEYRWGAARGLHSALYMTVGTGIGASVIIRGEPLRGLVNPEIGHVPLPHDRVADPFPGNCTFHGDCLEGLASGPAITARWSQSANTLPPDHPAWALEAHYLAHAMAICIYTLAPDRIILGGGVMDQRQLFPEIRTRVRTLLNRYISAPQVQDQIDQYIVPPGLGNQSGVLGALALAEQVAGP